MPVRKVGNKWTFGGAEYDSREKAERAYRAYLAVKFGAPKEDNKKSKKASKKTKKKTKKSKKKSDDEGDHEYRG